MKKMLSVFLAGLIMVMQVVPAFSYDRTESIKSTEATYDRCDDFYAQSYNNYVVENGFVFDLDTQTIVQFNASQYIESLIESTLDGSLEEENIGQEMSNMYVVVIPETIAGKTVRFIGNYSFANISIKQVFIPSCVEKIGDRAFENSGLQSVCLSEGLLEIGRNAFKGSATGTTIVVPSTVKYVDFHSNHHSTAYSFVFKSEDTKYNEFGYEDDEYAEPITKSDIVIDENATIPTLFEDTTSKSLDTYLWCHHTEANGFTYAYPISVRMACGLCGENFSSIKNNKCPYCQETILEEDGTWLTDISDEDYYALYKETHEGMELREYLIHKLVEANLIVDENTALVTDDEINTYLEENLVSYHFSWEDGKLTSSYYKWITGYDASLDESPEEITITEIDARITDVAILDNLEQLEVLNFNILSLIDWADYNSIYSYSWDGFLSLKQEFQSETEIVKAAILYAGVLSLANLGNLRLFSDCNKLKQVNITCEKDVSSLTEEELTLIKALITDYLSLAFKYCFKFDTNSVDYTFPSFIDVEIIDGAVYYNNRSVLLALLEDKETYEMPSSVTDVSTFALSNLKIDNVIWSENCSYIPFGCFAKSTIKSINFNGVKTIEDFAFYKTNISSIELPASVTTLGSCVFSGATITEFELPETVTSVGSALFANCLELKSITLNCNLSKVTLNNYPFFMSQTNKLGETTTTYSMMSYSYYAECGGPYDNTIFGFVPNLETLNIGSKVNDIYVVGYFPALIKITVDENNPSFYAKDNFLMRYDDEVAVLAPQGANFCDIPKDIPLEHFMAEYYKPINSAIASTSHFMLHNLDINHLYATGFELFLPMYSGESYMAMLLSVPNYLHSDTTEFKGWNNNSNYPIPETLAIVHEKKQVSVNTEDGAEIDIELRNVTDKVYKIPCWYELTEDDLQISEDENAVWYLGAEEFVSLDVSFLNSNSYYFSPTRNFADDYSYYGGLSITNYTESDSTLKAVRFVGDIDLLQKIGGWHTQLQNLREYFALTNVYNFELSPNTVKSVFPDNEEMHNIIDKYTWDDGYVHFTDGLRFPVLQTDDPSKDGVVSNFISEFLVPWFNAVADYDLDSTEDANTLLQMTDYSLVKVANMNGVEYSNVGMSFIDDMYFDIAVNTEYEIAKANLPHILSANNITSLAEFKQYYIDNYITFDEETQTLINISSVTGMTPSNLIIPARINGVDVKNVSVIIPMFAILMGSEVEGMYIPSTLEYFGCKTDNIDQLSADLYLKSMMIGYGFSTLDELDLYMFKDSGMEASALAFNINDDADLKNGLGILCSPEDIVISSANKHFVKRTNAVGNIEIVSADGKTCYAVDKGNNYAVYLSGLSTTYAPYSLGYYDNYDSLGIKSELQSCSVSVVMGVDGLVCNNCGAIGSKYKERTACPVCSSKNISTIQMDMQTMEYNYGATWQQSIFDGSAETKKISNVVAYNENSSFLTHCADEHDGKACCSYVDPSTLTGYILDCYNNTVEAYNQVPSTDETTDNTQSDNIYALTTNTDDVVAYSNEDIFQTQFFVIENQPEQYLDAGVIVVEPFQESKTVTLALKKGTVNVQVYDVENEDYFNGSASFNVYDITNDDFVKQINLSNGVATIELPIGSYYVVPNEIEDYQFDVPRLEVSLEEDGDFKELCFNISYYINYTVAIPEYIYPTQSGEDIQEYEISAVDVSLPSVKTLNLTANYSGELTNQDGIKLDYNLVQKGKDVKTGDTVLTVRKSDGSTKTASINAVINEKVTCAGVYTDTVTFTAFVN